MGTTFRAPASAHARATARKLSSEEDSPGNTGATSTLGRSPASASFASASRRCDGGAAPGSVRAASSSSTLPIDSATPTSVTLAASTSSSRSRRIMLDFVRMENGFVRSASTSTRPRVRR